MAGVRRSEGPLKGGTAVYVYPLNVCTGSVLQIDMSILIIPVHQLLVGIFVYELVLQLMKNSPELIWTQQMSYFA